MFVRNNFEPPLLVGGYSNIPRTDFRIASRVKIALDAPDCDITQDIVETSFQTQYKVFGHGGIAAGFMMRTDEKKLLPRVTIYTDGGCEPNPGLGGWAAILIHEKQSKEISGASPGSTNNRMELTAVIRALEALKKPCDVEIHSDSQYVVNGMSSWIHTWKKKNWQRAGKPVLNADLWQQLDELAGRHRIRWIWVRGHAGDHYNERCDELAQSAISRQRSMLSNDSGR